MGVFVLGVDPGRRGGWAVVEVSYGRLGVFEFRCCEAHALPYVEDEWGWVPGSGSGSGRSMILDSGGLEDSFGLVLDRYEDAVGEDRFFVVVERQQEVYGSGFVKGSFASGFNYGLLRGAVLFAFDWEPPAPVVFVASAREWKAGMGVPAEKEGARLLATSLFGGDGFWPRKKDEGMAEAALLAAWRGKFLAQRLWGIGR